MVTQHGDNVVGYVNAIKDYGINIWDCTCFIAVNSWKWWKWGEVWDSICQIGIDIYYINEKIGSTADEGFGTAISSLKLLFTSVTTLDTTTKYSHALSEDLNSDLKNQNIETPKANTQDNDTQNSNNTQNNNTEKSSAIPNRADTPIDQLHQGDIVIYNSQGKYTRYLQYMSIDNQTAYLRCPYDKPIILGIEDFKKYYSGSTDMRGDPKNLTVSSKRVNSLYQQQKKERNSKWNK